MIIFVKAYFNFWEIFTLLYIFAHLTQNEYYRKEPH